MIVLGKTRNYLQFASAGQGKALHDQQNSSDKARTKFVDKLLINYREAFATMNNIHKGRRLR
jgi:hypothetical protein